MAIKAGSLPIVSVLFKMERRKINTSRTPVFRDAGFELYDPDTAKSAFDRETENERKPELYIYSRYRNPTVEAAEDEIMNIENCEWAILTQSGMSAIDTALSIFQKGKTNKTWLFFSEIYGGTLAYAKSVLADRRGLEISTFSPENGRYDLTQFDETLAKLDPEIVYVETISNPTLIVASLGQIITRAHRAGIKVIVDNTFATPFLCRPLDLGADLVIHSATKYFSGHGDITAGIICGNDRLLMKSAVEYRKYVGHMLSPDDAYRLTTHMKTFALRFTQQCKNASQLSNVLKAAGTIGKVLYPGLPEHPTHKEAVELFGNRGFGGMITFDFDGSGPEEKRDRRNSFIRSVSNKIKLIPSLGDPNTILMPVESVWGEKYPEPGMIRLSAGFEDYHELESAVVYALEKLKA